MKVKREFYGNRHKQADKRLLSTDIQRQTQTFLYEGGQIQYIDSGVSGAKPKIKPSRNLLHAKTAKAT
jgi:hypothetical protein